MAVALWTVIGIDYQRVEIKLSFPLGHYFFNPVELEFENGLDNEGGATMYDVNISDPLSLVAGDYDINIISDYPQTAEYELYNTHNDEYIFRIDASNSTIIFDDSAEKGTTSTAAMQHGTYTGEQLARELERHLDDAD